MPASEHRIILSEETARSFSGRSRPPAKPDRKHPLPELSRKERDELVEQVEEFEGPDRREKRGSKHKSAHEPGVASS